MSSAVAPAPRIAFTVGKASVWSLGSVGLRKVRTKAVQEDLDGKCLYGGGQFSVRRTISCMGLGW